MKRLFFITLFFTVSVFAQTETKHWMKKVSSYRINIEGKSKSETEGGFLGALKKGYKFLISDYDGDNCPFTPSCSEFFSEAARKYGLVRGFLMFADRFTRDLNYFNRKNYPKMKNGKLFDPPEKYVM
jgi:putative component of membrane protein insertase Oxa1/YidC/SpoIIIJ protein YidD